MTAMHRRKRAALRLAVNSLLLVGSTALALLAAEATLRLVDRVPVLTLANFRDGVTNRGDIVWGYDPDLGWAQHPGVESGGFRTLAHGIRANGYDDRELRTGAVLAVGDSFTAGSEVDGPGSWPAQLEGMIGRPVINAGVGGYGTDQIVMRAEALLPVIRPQVLLIGFLDQDILRSGFSSYGSPKPYYMVERGELVLHNTPVPTTPEPRASGPAETIKHVAGYSYLVHRLMTQAAPYVWRGRDESVFTRVPNDPSDITCRLLQRLKRRTDELGIRTLLVMQYGGDAIRAWTAPTGVAVPVKSCAADMGIQLVDEFESLKAVFTRDAEELKRYYVMTGTVYGHMSPHGNRHIAALIAHALGQPPVLGRAENYAIADFTPGSGQNLLRPSESLDTVFTGAAFASLTPVSNGSQGQRVFRLAATGGRSEHYVSLAPIPGEPGPYTLSLLARPLSGQRLRLQLLDRASGGLLGDVDLRKGTVDMTMVGAAQDLCAGVTPRDDGWRHVWMSVRLHDKNPIVLLQLADRAGHTDFNAGGEAVLLRAVQLERGQSASPYQATPARSDPDLAAGDGRNRIERPEALETAVGQSAIAVLTPITDDAAVPRAYRLAATGPAGEHYVGIGGIPTEPGPHTLSLEARPAGGARLRLQILDDASNGALGDFDLAADTRSVIPLGAGTTPDGTIAPVDGDWRRLTLTAPLSIGSARVLLQVLDRHGGSAFPADGETIDLRAVKLERGSTASAYRTPEQHSASSSK
jgi:hypothetical protein